MGGDGMAKPAPITGAVLDWALSDAGIPVADAAARLKVDRQVLEQWITEKSQPNAGQFTALTNLLSRPPSFFFLPAPPKERALGVHFRSYADTDRPPGTETLEGIRVAERIQRVMAWILERRPNGAEPIDVPGATTDLNVEKLAGGLRSWLGWTVAAQTASGATDSSATKALRAALQDRSILALNLTLDEGVTRGFCIPHLVAPVVAVNTRDHVRARLFSYAHELVHLSLGEDSVCSTTTNRGVERFCNRVAAALLLPREHFVSYVRSRIDGGVLRTIDQVATVRNHFRVSLRAVAIRAEELKMAGPGLYDHVNAVAEPKGTGGRYVPGNERTKPRIRVDQYGHVFINSVVAAEDSGFLRRSQVLDLLRLSDGELATAKGLAAAGADE
jgi:Zn-dependent peptidase ImmA (M78 family)